MTLRKATQRRDARGRDLDLRGVYYTSLDRPELRLGGSKSSGNRGNSRSSAITRSS